MVAAALRILLQIWFRERRDGPAFVTVGCTAALAAAFELPALSFTLLVFLALGWTFPQRTLTCCLPPALIVAAAFFVTNWQAHGTLAVAYSHRSPNSDWETGNWYNYPGSYWLPQNRKGVDRGEPNLPKYAWNMLGGHHGIFSLSPIWLVSLVGAGLWPRRLGGLSVTTLILACTAAVIVFYLTRSVGDRNYGGMTSGFRWSFWLVPLFVAGMIPALDLWHASRAFRIICVGLLTISAFSAVYPCWNPWQHPWLFGWLAG
jgi:hypothetical protein